MISTEKSQSGVRSDAKTHHTSRSVLLKKSPEAEKAQPSDQSDAKTDTNCKSLDSGEGYKSAFAEAFAKLAKKQGTQSDEVKAELLQLKTHKILKDIPELENIIISKDFEKACKDDPDILSDVTDLMNAYDCQNMKDKPLSFLTKEHKKLFSKIHKKYSTSKKFTEKVQDAIEQHLYMKVIPDLVQEKGGGLPQADSLDALMSKEEQKESPAMYQLISSDAFKEKWDLLDPHSQAYLGQKIKKDIRLLKADIENINAQGDNSTALEKIAQGALPIKRIEQSELSIVNQVTHVRASATFDHASEALQNISRNKYLQFMRKNMKEKDKFSSFIIDKHMDLLNKYGDETNTIYSDVTEAELVKLYLEKHLSVTKDENFESMVFRHDDRLPGIKFTDILQNCRESDQELVGCQVNGNCHIAGIDAALRVAAEANEQAQLDGQSSVIDGLTQATLASDVQQLELADKSKAKKALAAVIRRRTTNEAWESRIPDLKERITEELKQVNAEISEALEENGQHHGRVLRQISQKRRSPDTASVEKESSQDKRSKLHRGVSHRTLGFSKNAFANGFQKMVLSYGAEQDENTAELLALRKKEKELHERLEGLGRISETVAGRKEEQSR